MMTYISKYIMEYHANKTNVFRECLNKINHLQQNDGNKISFAYIYKKTNTPQGNVSFCIYTFMNNQSRIRFNCLYHQKCKIYMYLQNIL